MKIIVPLAGENNDFLDNFGSIKPLTKVGNETIIEKFLYCFRFDYEYIFICKLKDVLDTCLIEKIKSCNINYQLIITETNTANVIETILYADKVLNSNDSIIVVHPDAEIHFDKSLFLNTIEDNHGMVFSYNHFNPTFLKSDLVGRCKIDSNNYVLEIKEKSIFNEDEETLAGIYYYSKWSDFKKYSKVLFDSQNSINGIFYESQVYNEYIKANKKVKNFRVNKFISLGLIKNVEEYNFWHKYKNVKNNPNTRKIFNQLNLIPACGEGKRFADNGYKNIKPLIEVQNTTMLNATINALPKAKKNIVIVLEEHEKKFDISGKHKNVPNTEFISLDSKTDGMARTCMKVKDKIDPKMPLLISSCDYSLVYNEEKLNTIIETVDPDVIIWTFKNYPDARVQPYAYAYISEKNGFVTNISEKIPISSKPNEDQVVQGIFYFKNAELFFEASNSMFEKKNHVNGEYYIATSINELIEMNKKVIYFEVDQYICWGTPHDLETYNFWMSIKR
jgi:choline kinase